MKEISDYEDVIMTPVDCENVELALNNETFEESVEGVKTTCKTHDRILKKMKELWTVDLEKETGTETEGTK